MKVNMKVKTKDTLFALFLLAPALIALTLLFVKPLIDLVTTSLTNQNLLRPDRLNFIGLENYGWMFSEPKFWRSIGNSIVFTTAVTAISILISMLIALLMNIEFRFKRFLFAIILLPWVTSFMSSAFVFTLLYDYSYGVLNYLFSDVMGLIEVQNWLGQLNTALGSVIVVSIWHFLPFSILVLSNALKQVPQELHESARIDGASNVQTFFHITMPMIKPSVITLLIVRFAAAFKTFDSIYLLTKGGPGDATTTLPMWYYQIGFESFRSGKGATVGVVLILFVLIIYFAVIKLFGEDAL